MPFETTYREGLTWYRGNLHTHTTESDGHRTPSRVIEDYAARGYDFLMLSDHDMITDPSRFDDHGLLLIPGNEVTARGGHILHVDARRVVAPDPDRSKVLADIASDSGFAVMAHPNWHRDHNHWPQERLATLQGYVGIEIFNGVLRRLPGKALATDRWDMLLCGGRRVWGFAHDDSHEDRDVELGWIVVQAEQCSREAILDAIREGRFYASTGVVIDTIELRDDELRVYAPNADRIVVLRDAGRRVHQVDARELRFTIPADVRWQYLRVECYGAGEAAAWTQPFFQAPST